MNARDIELAAQAGAHWEHGDWNMASSVHFSEEELKTFADLIRADEREACAKVCENEAKEHERNTYDARDGRYDWQADGANACAAAIRARGNT